MDGCESVSPELFENPARRFVNFLRLRCPQEDDKYGPHP